MKKTCYKYRGLFIKEVLMNCGKERIKTNICKKLRITCPSLLILINYDKVDWRSDTSERRSGTFVFAHG